MILSNVSIQQALDNGWLFINPEPTPRQRKEGVESPYQTTAVDLRLHEEIRWLPKELGISMDLSPGSIGKLIGSAGELRVLNDEQPLQLEPGRFVLGKTLEKVHLPLPAGGTDQPCYAARIEGRSSLSRCGLLVHFTAPTIHAGYNGCITLEICNLGPYTITLKAGAYVCQLIIELVHGTPFRNDSQFQEPVTTSVTSN